jgi:hypothetical protein
MVDKFALLCQSTTVAAEPGEKVGHRVPVEIIKISDVHSMDVSDDRYEREQNYTEDKCPPVFHKSSSRLID